MSPIRKDSSTPSPAEAAQLANGLGTREDLDRMVTVSMETALTDGRTRKSYGPGAAVSVPFRLAAGHGLIPVGRLDPEDVEDDDDARQAREASISGDMVRTAAAGQPGRETAAQSALGTFSGRASIGADGQVNPEPHGQPTDSANLPTGAAGGGDASKYAEMTKTELEDAAAGLTVKRTDGKDGAPRREDYIAALSARDRGAAAPTS